MSNVGMSPRARIVERRTYLRPLNEDGTIFETSDQMKDRVISHQRWLWENQVKRNLNSTEEAELSELRDLMDRSLVTMSGRVKWMGGTELVKARSSAAFNCSFSLIENPADMVDAFWLLLQGCGVGFKPVPGLLEGFNPAVTKIEVIESTRTEKGGAEECTETYDAASRTWRLTIGDSAKAWAKSLGKLLAGKYPATTIILDFSELRPAGKRLKGYGWLSSGWKPLEKAVTRICKLMIAASGRNLTAIEIGDIVNHLGTVLSSRRSAQIWLHDAGANMEHEFVNAKVGRYENGNEHREQSNNSLLFWSKPSRNRIVELLTTILDGGEPGFINAAEAKRRAPDFHGSNPCVTGDTPILTSRGYRPIRDMVGRKVDVWNGKEWSETTPFSTGVNPLVEVKFSDGTSLTCTPYHKFVIQDGFSRGPQARVEAKDLVIGDKLAKFSMPVVEGNQNPKIDAYSQGFYSGDGITDYKFSFVYEPKQVCAHRLVGTVSEQKEISGPQESTRATWRHGEMLAKDFVPLHASVAYKLNWLAGLFDSDGTVLTYDNGKSVQVVSIYQDFLNSVRLMLTTLGVQAKVVKASEVGHTQFRESEKAYVTKASWRLLINCQDVYHLHDELGMVCERLDLRQPYPQRDARRFVTVESVTQLERMEETFCFTEPKNNTGTFNGIVTGQCAEILLPSKGFCNLVQVVWHRFNGDTHGLLRAQYIAGRANYRQTCVDMKDGVLQLAWDNNQHLLRLCGVAPLGYVSWEGLDNRYMLEAVRDAAIGGANSMADEFGTPRPRRVTQVQPGGTSSKHLGLDGDEVHEGAHLALSRWIFNNINVSKGEPLLDALISANYRVKEHPFDKTAMLVTIPVEYPASPLFTQKTMVIDGNPETVEVNEESAVSQLDRYKLLMEHYVQHNCSITVSFDETEIGEMSDWFMENWDSYVGVSFLRRNDPTKTAADLGFAYLPQEAVSKRMYDEYVANLWPLDLSGDKSSDLLDMGECSSGVCPVR